MIKNIAAQWREQHPDHTDGVVLIWENRAYGWKNCLRDANHERPGAIAVDVDGHIYVAQGGDDYNGAELWVVNE